MCGADNAPYDTISIPNMVDGTKSAGANATVVNDDGTLKLALVRGGILGRKRRAPPLGVTSLELTGFYLFMKLFVNPLRLFATKVMGRRPHGCSSRNRIVLEEADVDRRVAGTQNAAALRQTVSTSAATSASVRCS